MATMKRNNVSGQLESVYESVQTESRILTPFVKDAAKKAAHTFWQTFTAVFFLSLGTVTTFSALRDLAIAAASAGIATTLSFLKTYIVSKFTAKGAK